MADFDIAAGMLEYFFRKEAGGSMILSRPRAVVSVPFGATNTEKLTFYQVASRAGAKSVGFVPELLAAAIGCGMRIEEPKGKMIVNVGGGVTEAAVLSFGGVVLANSVRVGGETFDTAISNFLRRKYGVAIGDVTAEQLKVRIGSVLPGGEELSLEVRGRNMRSCGRPISITVKTSEIMDTLRGPTSQIIECIRATFERTPPELCADIYESGLVLTGGLSMLRGLGELIEKRTGIRTLPVKKPLDSVAAGLGVIIEKDDPFGVIESVDR